MAWFRGLLTGAIVMAGTFIVGAGTVSAEPAKMKAELHKFETASHDLIFIYQQTKALADHAKAVVKRRAHHEKAIEAALKTLNPKNEHHGVEAERVFDEIVRLNQLVEKAHLAVLDAQGAAHNHHAGALADQQN